jgi:hypothetical protein
VKRGPFCSHQCRADDQSERAMLRVQKALEDQIAEGAKEAS